MMRTGQNRLLRKRLVIAGFTASLLAPMCLIATEYDYSPRAMAMLPPYCKYTQLFRQNVPGGGNLSEIKKWYEIMGGSYPTTGPFHHMHHYCAGLQHINHAKFVARSQGERNQRFSWAVLEFEYVLKSTTPAFALWPEILTKKGESLIAMGKAPLAIADLLRAIELKPDYWPPYAALSDYYKNNGNPKMAREALEQALSFSPNAQAMKRRLAELDGVKEKPGAAPRPATKPAPPPEQPAVTHPAPEAQKPPAER